MSRLLESSLTGKISKALFESSKITLREQNLNEAWKYTIKAGSDLRKAIEDEDPAKVLDMIQRCCLEVIENSNDEDLIDEFDRLKNEVADEISMENVDEDSADYWLGELYDLCDNVRVFVGLQECDEPKEVKPIEKTREELIRDHGTDDVDLINAGKESEERVALKETEGFVNEIDAIADFMIDFDKYGFEESYDGDADAKRDQLIQDITRDRKTVACYLNDVVVEGLGTEEQQAEAKRLLGSADLEKYIKTNESMSDEDLERVMDGTMDDYSYSTIKAKEDADKKKAIEDRIAELRLAIEDGVSEDEKADMEKEIAELEGQLNEGDKLEEGEDSQGALKTFSDGLTEAIRLQELRNAEEMGEFFQEAMGILRSVAEENGYMVEGEKLEESVSVATTDGSTVDTQDAASVQSNDGTVTVVTGDTTVVINNTPAEPALDIPVEEPIEEVPTEEIIDEPVEEIPAEEVPVEEPLEDEVIEESDDEYGIDANVDAKSLAVLKNQGITYMLQIEETSGKTTYWVCDNFNAETNEGDNAEVFTEKEKADEEYFKRVGLEPTVEEE